MHLRELAILGFISITGTMGLNKCIVKKMPAESAAVSDINFKKNVLSEVFVSEGVAVADVNKDGITDVLAGAWWWEAPSWKKHELAIPDTFTYDKGYSTTFLNFCLDINQDGWVDLIRMDQPGQEVVWYENPKNKEGHWQMRMILETAGNENPVFADIDGDGRGEIICNDNIKKEVIWLQAPVKKGDTTWKRFVISNNPDIGTHKYTHGLGYGDLNKDGRKDVFINSGWWECPADPRTTNWTFHRTPLGAACGDMYAFDVDGDKDMDVISSSAHDYGVWWFEQINTDTGISFIQHLIDSTVSETHSLQLKDINGDGNPDLITGKRYFAHNGGDRGAYDPSILFWLEYKPGKQPQWISHQIDNNSGVGIQFVVQDMNKDRLPDIVISNKKGVFVFEREDRRQ